MNVANTVACNYGLRGNRQPGWSTRNLPSQRIGHRHWPAPFGSSLFRMVAICWEIARLTGRPILRRSTRCRSFYFFLFCIHSPTCSVSRREILRLLPQRSCTRDFNTRFIQTRRFVIGKQLVRFFEQTRRLNGTHAVLEFTNYVARKTGRSGVLGAPENGHLVGTCR